MNEDEDVSLDGSEVHQTLSRKTESNRRNAQKSTGPKTIAGKSRSRMNALKNGLFAKNMLALLSKHDGKAYMSVLRELIDHYSPADLIEELLVKKIAECIWREAQAQTWESRLLERLDASATQAQNNIISTITVPRELERLVEYGNRFRSRTEKLIAELERRQSDRVARAGYQGNGAEPQ